MAIEINGTTGISGVNGSATTPALQGQDTNTGISFGTDEVNIVTNGETQAKVDSSGRVLIGQNDTTGVDAEADDLVVSSTAHTGITVRSGNNHNASLYFADQDAVRQGRIEYSQSGEFMRFNTSGTECFRFGDSGQLGIAGANYGTSGQVLTSGGASAAPSWADAAGISVARVTDTKTAPTAGGTFTSGAWRTRDLNTEEDPDGIVTIASNQFTLGAGTYLIQWSAPALVVERHQTRLWDVTGATNLAQGSGEYADPTGGVQNRSMGFDIVTLTANNTFQIQHRCSATRNTNGFGTSVNLGDDEVYTMVTIFKLS